MLEVMSIDIENALAIRLAGKITEDDMVLALSQARKKIKQHGNIVVLEQIDSLRGVSFKALVEEMKYLFEMGLSNVSKIAVLSDAKWIEKVVKFENKLFRKIDMKCFKLEDRVLAEDFLREI